MLKLFITGFKAVNRGSVAMFLAYFFYIIIHNSILFYTSFLIINKVR